MRLKLSMIARTSLCLGLSLLNLLVNVAASNAAQNDAPQRPNILLLLSDDHSYPFLSTYGNENVKTPNLDSLAKAGFQSHRFFTACPQCVPSRGALLTGASPVAIRMTRFSSPLPGDQETFVDLLKKNGGYFVGVCGRSYHLDGSGAQNNPVLENILSSHGLRTFKDRVDFLQGGPDRDVPAIVGKFLDDRPKNKPFFLWANFSDPHHVWDAPEEYRPDPTSLTLPSHLPDLPGVRDQLADYCAEVNRLDASVGKVLQELHSRNLEENTLIFFLGDNGAALPHGKGSLYDPGSNVPFLAKGPGIRPGGDSSDLLSGEDLAPTLLEAANIPAGSKMTGRSFWPLLIGQKFETRKFVFVERGPHGSAPVSVDMSSSGYDLGRAVRSAKFKFIYNCTPWIPYSPVDSAGGKAWTQIKEANQAGSLDKSLALTYFQHPRPVYELYDLEKDPGELNNIAGTPEYAQAEDELRAALIEKMVLDFDYLPLPTPYSEASKARQTNGNRGRSNRQQAFLRLDKDGDGKLNWDEFRGERKAEEAKTWFDRRDGNRDGYIDKEEYLADI